MGISQNQILHAKFQIFKHKISNLDIKSQSYIFKNTQISNLCQSCFGLGTLQ